MEGPITDRPVIAQAICDALRAAHPWPLASPHVFKAEIVARVLAEHETALEKELESYKLSIHHATSEAFESTRRAEVAEARCAQLEQEAAKVLMEQQDRLIALQAEHERLRGALECVEVEAAQAEALTDATKKGGQHVGRSPQMQRSMALKLLKLCRAALAPSQEPTT